jgi:hypothetical protein
MNKPTPTYRGKPVDVVIDVRSAAARATLTRAGYTKVIDGGAMSAAATQLR